MYRDLFNPGASQAINILLESSKTRLYLINKIFYLLSQFFIIVGLLNLMLSQFKRNNKKIDEEFTAFAIVCFAIFLACIFIPHFTGMNVRRMFHILLFLLAPFCVIGGIMFLRKLAMVIRARWTVKSETVSIKILSLFLILFMLFNIGFVFEIAKDQPYSISISQESMKDGGKQLINRLYDSHFTEEDILGVRWLSKHKEGGKIFADIPRLTLLFTSYGMMPFDGQLLMPPTENPFFGDKYIFLGYPNVKYGILSGPYSVDDYWEITEIYPILVERKNEIYSNGNCEIYK